MHQKKRPEWQTSRCNLAGSSKGHLLISNILFPLDVDTLVEQNIFFPGMSNFYTICTMDSHTVTTIGHRFIYVMTCTSLCLFSHIIDVLVILFFSMNTIYEEESEPYVLLRSNCDIGSKTICMCIYHAKLISSSTKIDTCFPS